MIRIFTDSTSYIPSDIQLEYGISVLPLSINIEGNIIPETEISNEHFYKQIKKSGLLPTVVEVPTSKIESAFEAVVDEGDIVVAIFMSSRANATYKNAIEARENIMKKNPKATIKVIDSLSFAMAEGLAVLAAAEAARRSKWFEEVVEAAQTSLKCTKFLFIPSSTKFSVLGGRINKAQAMVGKALQVTPILEAKNGEIGPREVVVSRAKAMERMLEIFKAHVDIYGAKDVVVQHIDCMERAEELAERLRGMAEVEVSICDIGPVVGCQVGPGALGIVYRTISPIPEEEE
ncbi:MAG: DegV family protein [Clostridia bacterium]|nr:DegV family protein [Clostridia bacterium]